MAETLQTSTSTLMVKLPEDVQVLPYQEKTRVKKMMLRTIIKTLQTRELELVYVGYKPEYINQFIDSQPISENRTFVTINVLDDNGSLCDFNSSQNQLLRKFKRELQYNSEHIIIDRVTQKSGFFVRHIEIYIRSRFHHKPAPVPNYTLAISSSNLAVG